MLDKVGRGWIFDKMGYDDVGNNNVVKDRYLGSGIGVV